MLLSIGMIVKNEEKYLEKCLTALKPILDQVDSELIIADTGSTDRTVEIAKKFTDNVFHFEWINDFAAARNSTLDRAKGKWYMFIDADEIIRDCSELIRFFNSGEYKKYGSALYTIRNLTDLSRPDIFSDFRAFRMTSLKNGVRFQNPVHEIFSVANEPIKDLKFSVDHYGYIYADNGVSNGIAQQKARRNLELLMEELAQQKSGGEITNELLYQQISDCYSSIDEKEKALEYLEEGMAVINPKSITISGYYSKRFRLLLMLERYSDVIELCKKYFSKANLTRTQTLATDCTAYFSRARAYFMLEDYEKVIPDLAIAFDMYKKYINNELYTPDLIAAGISINTYQLKLYCDALYECCEKTGMYNKTAEILERFPIEVCFSDPQYMSRHLVQRAAIMEQIGFSAFMELYDRLDDSNQQMIIYVMLWHIFESDKPEQVIGELRKLTADRRRLAEILNIYECYFVKKDLIPEEIDRFIYVYGTAGNENIWGLMMYAGYDITPYINHFDFDLGENERLIFLTYTKATELFAGYDIGTISAEGLEKAAKAYVYALVAAHRYHGNIVPLFEKFGEVGAKWLRHNPFSSDFPYYIGMALCAHYAVVAQKDGDMNKCLEYLNDLTKAIPSLEPAISDYRLKISPTLSVKFKFNFNSLEQAGNTVITPHNVKYAVKDDPDLPKPSVKPAAQKTVPTTQTVEAAKEPPVQTGRFKVNTNALSRLKNLSIPEQSADDEQPAMQKYEPPKPKTEFERLAEQFKRNIRAMVSAGNTADAQSLISQYEQLCPNDPEISEIKKQL